VQPSSLVSRCRAHESFEGFRRLAWAEWWCVAVKTLTVFVAVWAGAVPLRKRAAGIGCGHAPVTIESGAGCEVKRRLLEPITLCLHPPPPPVFNMHINLWLHIGLAPSTPHR
jgi:hypothetical protein